MEVPKLLILLSLVYRGYTSHSGHTIPVEHYETELQNLGQHVEIPETPVRVIKITKTVAVKVPIPYPVKIIEKVPYPVHVSKPYPVPVPQIIKVPHVATPSGSPNHEALGSNDDQFHHSGIQQGSYGLQSKDGGFHGDSYAPEIQSYNGGHSGPQSFGSYGDDSSSEGSPGNSYEGPSHSYYGDAGGSHGDSFDSKSYDDALKDYLQKINNGGNSVQNYNYH